MQKYLTLFQISWQGELVYRFNFILWRFRNILRLLMTYFLWNGIFISNQNVFGYQKTEMFTYVFAVLAIQTLVLSAPSSDNIGSEISSGDLGNYLLKPINYLKYWFTRDLSSKLLNIIFASGEIAILWFLLKPQLTWPNQTITLPMFLLFSSSALLLYFFLNLCSKFIAFWHPENTWGLTFLMLVMIEILAGGIFPLDILPTWASTALQFTPFPYLIYFPIAVFLEKITGLGLLFLTLKTTVWIITMYVVTNQIWKKGLRVFGAYGK